MIAGTRNGMNGGALCRCVVKNHTSKKYSAMVTGMFMAIAIFCARGCVGSCATRRQNMPKATSTGAANSPAIVPVMLVHCIDKSNNTAMNVRTNEKYGIIRSGAIRYWVVFWVCGSGFGSFFGSFFGSGFGSFFGSGFGSFFGSGFGSFFGSFFGSGFGSFFGSGFGSFFGPGCSSGCVGVEVGSGVGIGCVISFLLKRCVSICTACWYWTYELFPFFCGVMFSCFAASNMRGRWQLA